MAKKSLIARDEKRQVLELRFREKRSTLRAIIKDSSATLEDKLAAQKRMQNLPFNSCKTRIQRRCSLTGRPHAVYRRFGLCRHALRRLASCGDIPGMRKASW